MEPKAHTRKMPRGGSGGPTAYALEVMIGASTSEAERNIAKLALEYDNLTTKIAATESTLDGLQRKLMTSQERLSHDKTLSNAQAEHLRANIQNMSSEFDRLMSQRDSISDTQRDKFKASSENVAISTTDIVEAIQRSMLGGGTEKSHSGKITSNIGNSVLDMVEEGANGGKVASPEDLAAMYEHAWEIQKEMVKKSIELLAYNQSMTDAERDQLTISVLRTMELTKQENTRRDLLTLEKHLTEEHAKQLTTLGKMHEKSLQVSEVVTTAMEKYEHTVEFIERMLPTIPIIASVLKADKVAETMRYSAVEGGSEFNTDRGMIMMAEEVKKRTHNTVSGIEAGDAVQQALTYDASSVEKVTDLATQGIEFAEKFGVPLEAGVRTMDLLSNRLGLAKEGAWSVAGQFERMAQMTRLSKEEMEGVVEANRDLVIGLEDRAVRERAVADIITMAAAGKQAEMSLSNTMALTSGALDVMDPNTMTKFGMLLPGMSPTERANMAASEGGLLKLDQMMTENLRERFLQFEQQHPDMKGDVAETAFAHIMGQAMNMNMDDIQKRLDKDPTGGWRYNTENVAEAAAETRAEQEHAVAKGEDIAETVGGQRYTVRQEAEHAKNAFDSAAEMYGASLLGGAHKVAQSTGAAVGVMTKGFAALGNIANITIDGVLLIDMFARLTKGSSIFGGHAAAKSAAESMKLLGSTTLSPMEATAAELGYTSGANVATTVATEAGGVASTAGKATGLVGRASAAVGDFVGPAIVAITAAIDFISTDGMKRLRDNAKNFVHDLDLPKMMEEIKEYGIGGIFKSIARSFPDLLKDLGKMTVDFQKDWGLSLLSAVTSIARGTLDALIGQLNFLVLDPIRALASMFGINIPKLTSDKLLGEGGKWSSDQYRNAFGMGQEEPKTSSSSTAEKALYGESGAPMVSNPHASSQPHKLTSDVSAAAHHGGMEVTGTEKKFVARRSLPDIDALWAREIPHDEHYDSIMKASAAQHVPPALLWGTMMWENRGKPSNDKVSPKGATGLMQIMPDTARGTGVDPSKLLDPEMNVLASARVYGENINNRKFNSFDDITSAYNSGWKKEKWDNEETREYPGGVRSYIDKLPMVEGGQMAGMAAVDRYNPTKEQTEHAKRTSASSEPLVIAGTDDQLSELRSISRSIRELNGNMIAMLMQNSLAPAVRGAGAANDFARAGG